MIEGMKTTLAELGVPDGQIRSEAFEAAVASTVAPETDAEDPPAQTASNSFQLHLVDTDATIEITNGETLLAACDAAGIAIPSACRAGVCGTCRARLVNGAVRCDSDLLDENDRADGYILPCIAWPESDCVMEA
jgi:ferredoxin